MSNRIAILSHKYKFIYIKAHKTAGSSISAALVQHCGKEDRIRAVPKFKQYTNNPLAEGEEVPEDIWSSYYKMTVIRNPWDYLVSLWWWRKYWFKVKLSFDDFVVRQKDHNGRRCYFNKDGSLVCDHYMRFEHLEKDYTDFCEYTGNPLESPLPRLKTFKREDKRHYREYYTKETKDFVSHKFKRFLKVFDYEF